MKLTRRLASVAGAAVIALGVAAPAHAARYDHADAAGDVLQCDAATDADCAAPATAATQEPDVTNVTFRHRAYKVVVFAQFADLAPTDDLHGFVSTIRTNEGVNRVVSVYTAGTKVGVEFTRPSGASVRCSGIRRAVDYDLNTVRIVVPRSCLSYPRWIQANFGAISTPVDQSWIRADDAQQVGEGDPAVDDFAFSPRIKRA